MSLQMLDNRFLTYFHHTDGSANLMASWLECQQLSHYFTLCKQYPHSQPFEYFVEHLWFSVSFAPASLMDIELYNRKPHGAFRAESYTSIGMQGMQGIGKLLDEGYIVPFQTYEKRVPFFHAFRSFTEPYTGHHSGTPHTFIAIGHTQNELYYAEAPWSLREIGHVGIPENKSVGVISKSDLLHAFDCFVKYDKIELDREAHQGMDCDAYLEDYLRETSNLEKKLSKASAAASGDNSLGFHAEGLERLYRMLEEDMIQLSEPSGGNSAVSNGDLLHWKFNQVRNRRAILEQLLLKRHSSFPKDKVERTVYHLQQNITLWDTFLRSIKKMVISGSYTFRTPVRDYLLPLVESESFLADSIRNLHKPGRRK
ncbi:hypothetical protein PCCS19_29980 [Paenibacillus sp. CCS19]|uniref:hypothetical protein n=1 Tax=Paenibacillus sp. CCS19 TaxID=3158387 RepID=UPI00256A88F9|nr:hypothetical protein [Paenibacillus cellulosilyticus]GMK39943.1 hypothetical protein PCCS19_29980 [Paenibacillus cellulosilyticus]